MLEALFEICGGLYTGCAVTGHAEYSEDDPSGMILCASVSSAMQLTCNTLTECFDAEVRITQAPTEDALNQLAFVLEKPDAVQSQILRGLLIHFQALSEDYDGMLRVSERKADRQQHS